MVGKCKRGRRVMANHVSTLKRLRELRRVQQRQWTELGINALRNKTSREVRKRLEYDHIVLKATDETRVSHNCLNDRLIRQRHRDTFPVLSNGT